MIYLALAVISSAMVSVCMRFGESHIKNQMGMFMSNYAVCMAFSLLLMENDAVFLGSSAAVTVGLGVISGFLYLGGFVFLKYNMRHNGIVLASTFMKLGVLIPTIMAIVVFHELPGPAQIAGIVLAVCAILLINFEKDALKKGNKKIWLLVLLLVSGLADAMANVFEQSADGGKDGYLFLTFLTAFLLTIFLAFREKQKICRTDILWGLLIGVPNYFSARFLLLSLGSLQAVLVYPACNVATIVLVSLAGVLIFHETIGKKKAFALGLILLALILLNI